MRSGRSIACLFLLFTILSASVIAIRHSEAGTPNAHAKGHHCTALHAELTEDVFLREPAALKAFITALPKVFHTGTWLQIGAHTLDPQAHTYQIEDPLVEYLPFFSAYRKVFVEPVPFIFSELQNNTQGMDNVDLINAAIVPASTTAKTITMYCPVEEFFHQWLRGICSMDKAIITKAVPDRAPREVQVSALTVPSLFATRAVENVRVVVLNTQGYDFKILEMLFEVTSFHPDIVVFEHTEITPVEHQKGIELLHSLCYVLAFNREYTFGLRLVSA